MPILFLLILRLVCMVSRNLALERYNEWAWLLATMPILLTIILRLLCMVSRNHARIMILTLPLSGIMSGHSY